MKNVNIGIVNLIVSNKLKESYFNNNLLEESKKLTTDFFNVVKNSPILQLEFKIFNNIENKHIENDLSATRYIDNNIKLFEVYTIGEIDAEREKLKNFIMEEAIPQNTDYNLDKVNLYNAIDDLITESLSDYDKIDVDSIHESFTTVLNYIKKPKEKKQIVESELKLVNDDVVQIAINKFNEKYDDLNEGDKNLLKLLIKSNTSEKQELLEEYKSESLRILESAEKDGSEDKVQKAMQKIREMIYNPKTVNDDIINLHYFKKELL